MFVMQQHQPTPHTLSEAQDQLLLAGSKLTFTDIYEMEMKLPIIKGKFYRADDVDNTFILLNGVLTDVSQQAFQQQRQWLSLQEEHQATKQQLQEAETVREDLQQQLTKRNQDLQTLARASKMKINQLEAQIKQLQTENNELGDLIDQLVDKINERKDN